MNFENEDLLDAEFVQDTKMDRKDLLPFWIKVFCWIFLIMGVLVPISLVSAFLGFRINIGIYGINTYGFSIFTLGTAGVFVFKGITAYGLLYRKDWAVKLAMADALIGILLSTLSMLVLPFMALGSGRISINFRMELLILFPYFLTMRKIRKTWEENAI